MTGWQIALDRMGIDQTTAIDMKGVCCGLGHCLNFDYSVNQDGNYCVHISAEVFEHKGQNHIDVHITIGDLI